MTTTRFTLAILFSIATTSCVGQVEAIYKPYNSADYPKGKYQLIRDTAMFLNYKIEIMQLSLNEQDSNTPGDFACRGWLTVSEGKNVISQKYFPVLEPVGACYGLFLPESQPRKDCFLISCFTHYDAEIFVIDTAGDVRTISGGAFYISNDTKLLFSHDGSDLDMLTVFDLEGKGMRYSYYSEYKSSNLADWYFIDGKYIATIWNYETQKIEPSQFAWFDIEKNEFKIITDQKFEISESKMLKSYNHRERHQRCNCGVVR